uniref:Uncharacterized protein n=1 Tax=Brassica campestris TaxID=3711 RepID=M4FA15_BRACM
MLFSEDPAHLERTIRKDQRSTSLDAAAFTSTDTRTQPSTDTRLSPSTDIPCSTSTDTTPRSSIDPQPRNMVAIVILRMETYMTRMVICVMQKATTTGIGSHQSCKPAAQASINEVAYTSLDRLTPTSLDKAPLPSIDRRYECGRRAYDNFGARKFRWEQKDEYAVSREEYGLARSATGDMIPVTKDDIRKVLERASLFGEGSICLPEQATSHTPTTLTPITLAPEI